LDEGVRLGRRLTLVSATAGFGKTTLVAEWLQSLQAVPEAAPAMGWLSLDDGDNDPARFIAYLLAALQRVEPEMGQSVRAMLQAPQPPPPAALLTALVNEIAAIPQPFLLVIDDYHVICTLPIHQQMAFILEHQPPQMHLVIASREDPPLPMGRLRARGQMTEIRQADLRFTAEEAGEFLRKVAQVEISEVDSARLLQRTEGWVAGLQLVALSLQGREDVAELVHSFSGSHRFVLDYLVEEVFQRQSPEIREFLLKTSILRRFTAELCDAVLFGEAKTADQVEGMIDSRQVLRQLEQSNLFVVPLDQSRQWYRYHHLFGDLLRHRLQIEGESSAPLHQRASRWYEGKGLLQEAVHHALAAKDWERASSLILRAHGDLLSRGEVVTALGWFEAMPEEIIRADPYLCSEYCWPLILTEQIEAAEFYLALAEQAAQEVGDQNLLGEIAVAQVHIARTRGDHSRAAALSERALALLPPDDLSSRSIVAINLGIAQWFRGRMVDAGQTLAEAQRAAQGSGNTYTQVVALVFLSRIKRAQGQLRQAAASLDQIIQESGQEPFLCLAHYDKGRLLYEWNDLPAAADHLERGIELCRRGGGVEFLAGGCAALMLIKQAQGDRAAVQQALQESRQLLRQPEISPATRLYSRVCHLLVALDQGDITAASHLSDTAPAPQEAGSFPDYLFLMLAQARLLLAQDRQDQAAGLLGKLYEMATQAGWRSVAIQARALQAVAAPTPEEGLAFLKEALTLAEPEDYVRAFMGLGQPMEALLQQAAAQGVTPAYVGKLLQMLGGLDSQQADTFPRLQEQRLPEPLSDREFEVLHLLVQGRTYQEIAETLYISVNTVKTHLKNIYGKLGVANRREAAAKAKQLELLQ
jgi:LuxR family maltose regulon positive regulatory protein